MIEDYSEVFLLVMGTLWSQLERFFCVCVCVSGQCWHHGNSEAVYLGIVGFQFEEDWNSLQTMPASKPSQQFT